MGYKQMNSFIYTILYQIIVDICSLIKTFSGFN